jgi:glycosyltransferase involved in cell wall biosynthesis
VAVEKLSSFMSEKQRFVVAHAGARDHYQLALGLQEAGMLDQLVTDWYTPDLLYSLFPARTGNRYRQGLGSGKVNNCIAALAYAVKMKFNKSFADNIHKDRLLSKAAMDLAIKHGANLFLYSYYAWDAFSRVDTERRDIRKLLFQLHPHPASIKKLLIEELEQVPQARASLMYENEMRYSDDYLARLGDESILADAVMVASSYTGQTLAENGVEPSRIVINPYGIDANVYQSRERDPQNKKLRILFVGSMVQRKGLFYLLSAASKLPSTQVEVVLCGRGFIDYELIRSFGSVNIDVKVGLSSEGLVSEMHKADVFVLPSLTEGFAHVILEAMSAGLPVITTTNTCGPDVISEGIDGFVVPIRSVEQLATRLEWCATHKDQLFQMGQEAAKKARLYTWEAFRRNVSKFAENQSGT